MHGILSLEMVIGLAFDDSYLKLGITSSQPFELQPFCNIILLSFCMLSLSFFLSFIAKGLAMCRLGGLISAQKVLF